MRDMLLSRRFIEGEEWCGKGGVDDCVETAMAGDRAWVLDGAADALWVVNDENIMSDTVTTVAGLCRARAEMVGARDKAWASRRGRVDPLNYISLIERHLALVHNPASRLVFCLHQHIVEHTLHSIQSHHEQHWRYGTVLLAIRALYLTAL